METMDRKMTVSYEQVVCGPFCRAELILVDRNKKETLRRSVKPNTPSIWTLT